MSGRKRIIKEIEEMQKLPTDNCSAGPVSDNDIYKWCGTIIGPTGTPYEGGIFNLNIQLPMEYPLKPPHITFITRIYHCNINSNGSICLDILKNEWSPALNINKTLLSICSLLHEPNPRDPLVCESADELIKNKEAHDNTARQWTLHYASV